MRLTTASTIGLLTLLSATSDVLAHVGRGIPHNFKVREILPAGHGQMTPVKRAPAPAATDEPSAAAISSSAEECTPYSLPGMAALKSQFPNPWDTAQIVQGDTQATSVWNAIQKSGIIPADVKQKGTGGMGNFTDVTPSYSPSDPDCWWSYKECVSPKHPNIPDDIWQCAEPDTWGLTFDDGPNCTHNAFYDFLKANNQKASLFYIGSNVMDWPLQAQRGIVEGHHVCIHTWSHQYMTQLTDEQVFAELYYTGKAIKDVTGVTARCWRPPYGDVDDRVRAIATGLGMSTNMWSDDTDDWQVLPFGTKPTSVVEANYASIINENFNTHGNIVLTHEINGATMDMMMQMYPSIKKHFKNIVPLTACMNITNPYPEDITYPNFASYVSGNISPSGLPGTDIKVSSASFIPVAVASQTGSAAVSSSSGTRSNTSSGSSSGNSGSGNSGSTSQSSTSTSSASMTSIMTPLSLLMGIAALLAFVNML